jgi:hypothetical protein
MSRNVNTINRELQRKPRSRCPNAASGCADRSWSSAPGSSPSRLDDLQPVQPVLHQADAAVLRRDGRRVDAHFAGHGGDDLFAPVAPQIDDGDQAAFDLQQRFVHRLAVLEHPVIADHFAQRIGVPVSRPRPEAEQILAADDLAPSIVQDPKGEFLLGVGISAVAFAARVARSMSLTIPWLWTCRVGKSNPHRILPVAASTRHIPLSSRRVSMP